MKSDVFCAVGKAVFGRRWQAELADALSVTPRTVARWVVEDVVPDDIVDRLRPVVRSRVKEFNRACRAVGLDEVARG